MNVYILGGIKYVLSVVPIESAIRNDGNYRLFGLDKIMSLSQKVYSKYQNEGLVSLLYASIGFGYMRTIRPYLSCRRYPEIQGVEVQSERRCEKLFDSFFSASSWPQHHKEPNCVFIKEYVYGRALVFTGS